MTSAAMFNPLPPVERVRPGLWSVPVPLPMSSLRYVFVYVFETDRGPYIVDTGWNTDDAFAALSAGLKQVGSSIADVAGVLVTHIHPDHYGLAGRVREESGAWVGLHPADADHDDLIACWRVVLTTLLAARQAATKSQVLRELRCAAPARC